MKRIFIIGGDGFARECYYNILLMQKIDASIEFGGFLGHNGYGNSVDYKDLQYLYLGEESQHIFNDNEYAVIGAGYPELRKKIYNDLKKRNIKFFTIYVGMPFEKPIEIGEANVFAPPFNPSCNVKIGIGNVFNSDVGVGHDVEIGNFNFFGPRSNMLGCVKIGNDNIIGANVICLPNSKVGNNNKIAPLSAVYKGCKNNSYLIGNPALNVGSL